jgi:hypothetical protein
VLYGRQLEAAGGTARSGEPDFYCIGPSHGRLLPRFAIIHGGHSKHITLYCFNCGTLKNAIAKRGM